MAIRPHTRALIAQWLSSENFERLQTRTARAMHELGGYEHVVHFFHEPANPISWLMAQALQKLQERYDFRVAGHTLGDRGVDHVAETSEARDHQLHEAVLLAGYYRLKPPERTPSGAQVETVCAELLAQETTGRWLTSAIDLGNALFCSTAIPDTAQVLPGLEKNQELLEQFGHRRGGTIFIDGVWFDEVDGVQKLEAHFRKTGATRSPQRRSQIPILHPDPRQLPALHPRRVRFWFRLGDPYCYLAYMHLFALATEHQFTVELLPVANEFENDELTLRRKATAVMDAGREARRLHIPFGRIGTDIPSPRFPLWALFFSAEGDPERQDALIRGIFHAIWVRGENINAASVQRQIATNAHFLSNSAPTYSESEVEDALARNAEMLHGKTGTRALPAFEFDGKIYSGHQRLTLISEMLQNGRAT